MGNTTIDFAIGVLEVELIGNDVCSFHTHDTLLQFCPGELCLINATVILCKHLQDTLRLITRGECIIGREADGTDREEVRCQHRILFYQLFLQSKVVRIYRFVIIAIDHFIGEYHHRHFLGIGPDTRTILNLFLLQHDRTIKQLGLILLGHETSVKHIVGSSHGLADRLLIHKSKIKIQAKNRTYLTNCFQLIIHDGLRQIQINQHQYLQAFLNHLFALGIPHISENRMTARSIRHSANKLGSLHYNLIGIGKRIRAKVFLDGCEYLEPLIARRELHPHHFKLIGTDGRVVL